MLIFFYLSKPVFTLKIWTYAYFFQPKEENVPPSRTPSKNKLLYYLSTLKQKN